MTPAGVFFGVLLGVGACTIALLVYEGLSARVRRHRLRGNYFDARTDFRIVSRGPTPIAERSEELIARAARRAERRASGIPTPLLPKSQR